MALHPRKTIRAAGAAAAVGCVITLVACGSSGGGGDAATGKFCSVYAKQHDVIAKQGNKPTLVVKAYQALDDVAPSAVKPDVDAVLSQLHNASTTAKPDFKKLEKGAEAVASYAQSNC